AADVKDEPHALAAGNQIALHAFGKDAIGELAIGLEPVLAADLDAKGHPHPVGLANDLRIAALELLDLREEIRALAARRVLVVVLRHHADGLEGDRRAE